MPSYQPTSHPSSVPSGQPTTQPSGQPTCNPTCAPTFVMKYVQKTFDKRRYRTLGVCETQCSSHGRCRGDKCICLPGLNGDPEWSGIDCSRRACPYGFAWGSSQLVNNNDAHPWSECSNRGVCDRSTGECECYEPFDGHACQRTKCWNDCSGVGLCLPQRLFAENAGYVYDEPWDASKLWGCQCDLGYRGPDCSLRECPSSSDPIGGFGNEAGRDCSGRGVCNYRTGQCRCFEGFHGSDCSKMTWTY